MNVLDFLWGSLPLLLEFYADLYLKTDFEKTMVELETESNVPKIKTYDFIVGKFNSISDQVSFFNTELEV